MSRLIIICLAVGTVQFGVACENDASRSGSEGAAKATAAPSDVSQAREEYRRQKQADLAWLDKSIAEIEDKERSMPAVTKADYHNALTSLKAEREVFARDLGTAGAVVDSTWEASKARLDAQWTRVKAAAQKALDNRSPAAATYKPAQMTCEEFVALGEVQRPKVMYWTEGWNQKGRATGAAVDVRESDRWLPLVVADCTSAPKELLSRVVDKHALAAAKPAVAVPAPGMVTCTEFVTYDDVTKPKVVYWAEGFNKDGDATAAEVDIDATDRLLPTLVEDCKATPKLTLWQRIKSHL